MIIQRYNLYGDPRVWNGNIQRDVEGQWLRWKDVESYVLYAVAHGYIPPMVTDPTPQPSPVVIDVEENQLEMYDLTPIVDDDVDNLIMEQVKERFDGEEV